ncbi:MAG TPA: arginase family protein, partial [Candidatus Baltobacteraceae bacterium]|nr:arginase family protein [Candidatus Baltobacteraceae bacterium]
MLHVDLDVIAQEEFPAVNVPDSGGLSYAEVRSSFVEIVKQKNLLGLDVAQYNPDKDPDGSGAKKVVDLLADALAARLEALAAPVPPAASPATEDTSSTTA